MCKDKMCEQKKGCGTVKCVLAGMASGIALGVMAKILLDSNKKALKKKADKVIQAMGNLGDSAMEMFK